MKRTRRFGFKGGIHFCLRRYTWRQEIKELIRWAIIREERAEQIDVLGMGYEI